MDGLRQFLSRTRAFFQRKRIEKEMAEEMRLHVEHLTAMGIKDGLSPDEARSAAQRRFGGMDQIKEQCRDGLGWRILDELGRDFRFGGRVLLKNRGFTAVAVLTLALCIGANTAIFSMVYSLILKPLPYPEPDRIVEIYNHYTDSALGKLPSGFGQYIDYKTQTSSYETVGLWHFATMMYGEGDSTEKVGAARCTAEMFDILGLKPVIGQFFTLKNSRWGEYKVIVLTQSYWESHFNGDPGVLDKPVHVDGEVYRIIGVAPRSLEVFDARVRFIKPLAWLPDWTAIKYRFLLNDSLYGRLKPGVSVESAQAEATALEKHVLDSAPAQIKENQTRAGHSVVVNIVQAERTRSIKIALYLLQAGVVLVLLIGSLNIANLLLTRANGRQNELAIRTALGAGRWAIARQLLAECLLLTAGGTAIGIGLAWGAVHAMNRFNAKMLPESLPIAIDRGVLAYATVLAVSVCLLIGILPLVHILRTNLVELIHSNTRNASGGRRVRALSGFLVIGQVAIALILLVGAGLLVHSFANLIGAEPGFDPRNVFTARIVLPWSIAGDADRSRAFQERLLQGLREIPGVEDTALANGIPFQPGLSILIAKTKEGTASRDSLSPNAYQVGVSVGYFKTMHIQLLEGRLLDEKDTAQAWRTFVVDERFAQQYFPGRSAVGCHVVFGAPPQKDEDWPVIVGVVRNVSHNGLENRGNMSFVYWPLLPARPGVICLFLRSSRPMGDLASAVRLKLHAVDPTLPLFDADTLEHTIDSSFDSRRAIMYLLGGYASLALFLSAIGIYGVLAYDVSQRTREIGIRGAIGASRSQILGLVMRQGIWKIGVGLCVGLVCSVLLSRFMVTLLFELKPSDPWAYAAVSMLLAAVAVAASYLPARRAAGIDPIRALRTE